MGKDVVAPGLQECGKKCWGKRGKNWGRLYENCEKRGHFCVFFTQGEFGPVRWRAIEM